MSTSRTSDIPLVPLSNGKFEELRWRDDVNQRIGATPELGDGNDDAHISTQVYTGKCEQFDLSDPVHRLKYGELSAKLLSGAEYVRLWEERVPAADGKYYVYVTYVQVMTVHKTGNDRFELSEDEQWR